MPNLVVKFTCTPVTKAENNYQPVWTNAKSSHMLMSQTMMNLHYLIIQLFSLCDSFSGFVFIFGIILPSYLEMFFLLDSHLCIRCTLISSIIVTRCLALAATNTELNASDMLLTKVSHLGLVLNLDFLQNLGGIFQICLNPYSLTPFISRIIFYQAFA